MHPVTRTLRPALARRTRRLLAVGGLGVGLATLVVGTAAAPAAATHDRPPQGRQIEHYTVRPGDTPSELAVRFHAWTAELISHNHLGSEAGLVVGTRIEIPVVTSALPPAERRDEKRGDKKRNHKGRDDKGRKNKGGDHSHQPEPVRADPSRTQVRDEVVAASRYYGVDPNLALAVSWQEAGWQMDHLSSAGAIGAMQVLPATGEWMEAYAGRELRLRTLRDNAAAGVLLLDVLDGMTGSLDHRIGAYYQGPGAVQDHGLYPETRRYVANVKAIKEELDRGRSPR